MRACSTYIQVIALVKVQIVDRNLVRLPTHELVLHQLGASPQERAEQGVLYEVDTLLAEVDLLKELPAFHVHVIHHPLKRHNHEVSTHSLTYRVRVPIRVGEGLREAPCYPRDLPEYVVLTADAVDEPGDQLVLPFPSDV